MRRTTLALAAATLVASVATPALAHPDQELPPTAPLDVTYAATDNVEFLGRFPEHTGTAGGRLVGDRFYLTDPRGVYVYDVTTPEDPERLGFLPLPQSSTGVALAQEDPDTNGEILLVDAIDPANPTPLPQLQVVDVSDPADMSVLGSAPVTDHTWTCVSRFVKGSEVRPEDRASKGRPSQPCAYAYGRTGHIVDLTDPTQPEKLDTNWRETTGIGSGPYTHDLTEIRPGRVMSAGASNVLMDTSDPRHPTLLVDHQVDYHTYGYHSVEWARDGKEPIMVAGTEIAPAGATNLAGSDCQGEGSWISSYDASQILAAEEQVEQGADADTAFAEAEFVRIDEYHVEERGLFTDGNAPAHTLYCAHWMELAPDFKNGGRMVVGYYDWGTRFVDIAADGTMEEIGWFVPAEGYTGSAQWITEDIVYVMDYRRGMEVLRIGEEPATEVVRSGLDVIAAGSAIEPAVLHTGASPWPASATALAVGGALFAAGHRRRRRLQ